jgi:hypothetical protein
MPQKLLPPRKIGFVTFRMINSALVIKFQYLAGIIRISLYRI